MQAAAEFRSDNGRLLDAGDGGIQPDVLLPSDTLTDGEQLFAEGLGGSIPEYRNVLTRYALELAGQEAVSEPDFAVTDGMLATILQGLRAADIAVEDSVFNGAHDLISEQFGYELTRYVFGRAAELRRMALNDPQIAKAVELLQQAETTEQLLTLANERR